MTIDLKNISDETKVGILGAGLAERYTSMHEIRKRVQETGVWALGIMLGIGGWLVSTQLVLSDVQKCIYGIAVLLAVAAVRFLYLSDLCTGFKAQQRAAARIEETLGMYAIGIFDGSLHSIYPVEWKHAGTKHGDGQFFRTTYWLIYLGTGFVLFSIIAKNKLF